MTAPGLIFHNTLELLAMLASFGSLVIVCKSRKGLKNNYVLTIGLAFFPVGLLEMAHIVAGSISVVHRNYDHNLHIQLWIAARYVQNLSFIVAPFLIGRKIDFAVIFLAFAAATALLFGAIFLWKSFPYCYVEALGITNFEIDSEYAISQVLAVSAGLLFLSYRAFGKREFILLLAAMASSISSQLSYSPLMADYMLPNFASKVFLVSSYFLMFSAIVAASRLLMRSPRYQE